MDRRNAMDAEQANHLREVAREAIARQDAERRREEAERERQRQAEQQRRVEGHHPSQEKRHGN